MVGTELKEGGAGLAVTAAGVPVPISEEVGEKGAELEMRAESEMVELEEAVRAVSLGLLVVEKEREEVLVPVPRSDEGERGGEVDVEGVGVKPGVLVAGRRVLEWKRERVGMGERTDDREALEEEEGED